MRVEGRIGKGGNKESEGRIGKLMMDDIFIGR